MLQKQTQVAYTIWVRFMAVLVQSSQLSAVWARPVRLPFFEDNEPYLKSFEGFNLASKLEMEKTIAEKGNSCNDPNPVLISYDKCSKHFVDLWTEAANSMQVRLQDTRA